MTSRASVRRVPADTDHGIAFLVVRRFVLSSRISWCPSMRRCAPLLHVAQGSLGVRHQIRGVYCSFRAFRAPHSIPRIVFGCPPDLGLTFCSAHGRIVPTIRQFAHQPAEAIWGDGSGFGNKKRDDGHSSDTFPRVRCFLDVSWRGRGDGYVRSCGHRMRSSVRPPVSLWTALETSMSPIAKTTASKSSGRASRCIRSVTDRRV
jgi:hypothetical protein